MNAPKELVRQCFDASASTYDDATRLQRRIADELAHRAAKHIGTNAKILEIGCGTGHLTTALIDTCRPAAYIANDISAAMLDRLAAKTPRISPWCADAETAAWPTEMDAVVSASAVQWFDRPTDFVGKAAAALADGGILAFSTFGPQTFFQMRAAGAHGLDYNHADEWLAEMDKSFEIIDWNRQITTELYADIGHLLKNLKNSGANAASQKMTTQQTLQFIGRCRRQAPPDGRQPLTYEVLYFAGRKRGR